MCNLVKIVRAHTWLTKLGTNYPDSPETRTNLRFFTVRSTVQQPSGQPSETLISLPNRPTATPRKPRIGHRTGQLPGQFNHSHHSGSSQRKSPPPSLAAGASKASAGALGTRSLTPRSRMPSRTFSPVLLSFTP